MLYKQTGIFLYKYPSRKFFLLAQKSEKVGGKKGTFLPALTTRDVSYLWESQKRRL